MTDFDDIPRAKEGEPLKLQAIEIAVWDDMIAVDALREGIVLPIPRFERLSLKPVRQECLEKHKA